MDDPATLHRRLASFRASLPPSGRPVRPAPSADLAERLASAVDGEVIRSGAGTLVRVEPPTRALAIDRARLSRLPGQPPPGIPLLCLDTETTGLATAAGTLAFLVGLGWWEGERFRQVQLLLPEHADEPALLDALAGHVPADAWLVTYNGRGFDWPLLVTRFRMARRGAPAHGGHLDLLPLVRRVFRHRMDDARLRTAEASLLGIRRHGDVDGWEIPGRYLDFLRGGPAEPLADVVRHNDQDVRSLARLLAHVEQRFGDADAMATADRGDIAGFGRAYLRERRLADALACVDLALAAPEPSRAVDRASSDGGPGAGVSQPDDAPWWSPRRRPDFGGRPAAAGSTRLAGNAMPPWAEERLLAERAHLLRRLGRLEEAVEAWQALATGTSRLAVVASVELAKLRERRLRDPAGALEAVTRGQAVCDRRRRLGRPEPAMEADLGRRSERLRQRLGSAGGRMPGGVTTVGPRRPAVGAEPSRVAVQSPRSA